MNEYFKKADKEWYRHRLTGSMFCVMGAFVVLIIRLFYLQVLEGKEYRRLSENQCIRLQTIDSSRGLIFDRNGTLLVDNRPSFDVGIVLKDAKPVQDTIAKLSQYINVSQEELFSKIEEKKVSSYKPILLKRDIGRDVLGIIEVHKFDLPGIVLNVRQKRQYIHKESGAHLTGYIGEINASELKRKKDLKYRAGDFIGKFGAEKAFESFLRGKRGGRQVEVDARGRVVKVLKTVDAEPGKNIYLTIDHILQKKAESLIEGVAGAVVAMEPTTGHILAMASSPSFDPNAFVNGMSHKEWNSLISNPFRPMENKATQGEYPPGSTYKIITAIAGLEEGIINRYTTVYCPGYYEYGDRIFRCWKKSGHGYCNVVKALAESCDVYFYQAGQKLGVDQLAAYAKACGLGKPTGIEFAHESKGLVPTSVWKKQRTGISWRRGETLSVSIGQGANLATCLQIAVLFSAAANGGTLYKPSILKAVETEGAGAALSEPGTVIGTLPARKRTLNIVRRGLREVVRGSRGTARIAHIDGIRISGKTGTSQVFSRKKNDTGLKDRSPHLKAHAWFASYAEPNNPRIAVAVIVEHGEHGSSTAAPIAREVTKTFFSLTDSR